MALYTHLAAAIIGAALAGYAGWNARDWQADAELAELHSDAEETRRLHERAAQASVARVDRADTKRAGALELAAVADRSQLERLRRAIAARDAQPAKAACEPVDRQFAECRAALNEGAGLAVEGLRIGGGVDRQARGLRELAAGVTDDRPAR